MNGGSINNQAAEQPTPYPELNCVLGELAKGIEDILQGRFIGAYLQGSFAVGGYDEHSDVDFVIVYRQQIGPDELDLLQELHRRIYKISIGWAQHLEGTYFPIDAIGRPPVKNDRFWYLDNGSQELVESDHCNTLVVRWVLTEKERAICGPSPKGFIEPVPVDLLRDEIFHVICHWGDEIRKKRDMYDNRFYQTFIVLNYCRMLHDLIHGIIGSKQTGAKWAKRNLDPQWVDLIDRAWLGRPVPERSVREKADPDDFHRTLRLVEYITKESKEWMAKECRSKKSE